MELNNKINQKYKKMFQYMYIHNTVAISDSTVHSDIYKTIQEH